MRRITAALVAATLGLTACGGDDDTADEPATAEDTADDTAADTADEPVEETGGETADAAEETEVDTADTADTADAPDNGDEADAPDDGDDGGTIRVSSIDDIPQRCRDLMAEFLQDIEPIVSTVDWQTASFSDFEQIAADFEQEADAFESATAAEDECSDLDLETDDNFALLIEFADDVAPGTTGFLEFIATFAGAADPTVDDGDGTTGGAAGVSTCADAIAYMERLFEEYDSLEQVPVTELSEFTNLGMVMGTCSPEQLAFFDSDEFNDFVGG